MFLWRLELLNFRNHRRLQVEFTHRHTALLGANGAGKTNILEAVYFSGITRSFRTSNIRRLVTEGEDKLEVKAFWRSRQRGNIESRLTIEAGNRRQFLNNEEIRSAVEFFGSLPVVALVPEHLSLTQGAPANRRSFIDQLLSQQAAVYLDALKKYQRVLRIRNQLLQDFRRKSQSEAPDLSIWDAQMVTYGRELIIRRRELCKDLSQKLGEILPILTDGASVSGEVLYQPNCSEDKLYSQPQRWQQKELESGRTLWGPQRDDFVFLLDGKDLRSFGSQGQHKIMLVALKLAESRLLQERLGEAPVLLLDDLFSELDGDKVRNLGKSVPPEMQSVVTSTRAEHFREYFPGQCQLLLVQPGSVEPA